MTLTEGLVRERITAFKRAVAADLYSAGDIIDFPGAISTVESYRAELSALDKLLKNWLGVDTLAQALLTHPRLYNVLCAILALNSSVELEDGRRLPAPTSPPKDAESAHVIAGLLLELGISTLLSDNVDVEKLFLVVQIAADAPKRRVRVDAKIKQRIKKAVEVAVEAVSEESGRRLQLAAPTSLPSSSRRLVEYVVTVDGIPRIAVATTFQTYSGGRQTREMTALYTSVQSTLAASGVSMLLVADGQGMRSLSERVLVELFTAIPYTMSLLQAENDGLQDAFVALLSAPAEPSMDTAGLQKLIESALEQGAEAVATSLPVPTASARMALANYASKNSHLNLTLSPEGAALTWRNAVQVSQLRQMRWMFDGSKAISSLVGLLGAVAIADRNPSPSFASSLVVLSDDQVFPSRFVVCARAGVADAATLREVARHALQSAPESRVAVLLVSTPMSGGVLEELRDAQNFLPVTVVVVDVNTCIAMAQSRESPRDRLRSLLLEQTDLTKLSPFVVRGVTPSRVFFGREEEEATLLSTLSTNSVALLGGRRIGKTSLMRHSFKRLTAADLRPFFGDCQVVRTWADFGVMASRNWGVKLPDDFKPHHLFDLVAQLSNGSDRPAVILLDEIDQLLDWDKDHTDDQVPEAFFRACRSISQQGLAQFVFSGERTIAKRIWDATSPHWNFCRPLMLRQLTRSAAESLMAEPLEALGIRIDDRADFLSACWDSTDGHPELLQFLGDRIVGLVNQRDRKDVYTGPSDVLHLTSQFEYAEQYLETYWGQATELERLISILLIDGSHSVEKLVANLASMAPGAEGNDILGALHMLELYGIAKQSATGYQLRALWFRTALTFYGGPETAIKRYIGALHL